MKIRIIGNSGSYWKSLEGFLEFIGDLAYSALRLGALGFVLLILWNEFFAVPYDLILSFGQAVAILLIGHIVTGKKLINHKIDVIG